MTAWTGLILIGDPKPGEEVFVSAASGGVGLLVGQLAKIKGCRVVGSVGSDHKVQMLKEEFGFDDAFNYKSETDWDAALSKYFPRGIDIYFENVGGRMLEAVLNHINVNARIPVCGMISQYNQNWKQRYGVRNLLNLVGKCGKMQGFMVGRYLHRMQEFTEEMGGYMKEGKIKYKEDVMQGLESYAEAFNSLFRGGNTGKVLIQVSPS
uniref:Alcohol dehydrogenase-like C-terminal domain-containing protein n=1 Tax=Araucaria cunninghamii TaxID=56994 RepID=A0A0D6QZ62_ARACU